MNFNCCYGYIFLRKGKCHVENIFIRMPNSLGCSVAATAVIFSVLRKYPDSKIFISTKYPEMLASLHGYGRVTIYSTMQNDEFPFHVDLRAYTARRPHNSEPYRPSYIHMLEMAEEQLSVKLPIFKPKVILSAQEKLWAKKEVAKYDKPVIWVQTRTTTDNRNWDETRWKGVIEKFSPQYKFVDLSASGYTIRQSMAITIFSAAGICLDSFLVHGSAAVGAQNVLVLLGSSRPECVTYPNQRYLYIETCSSQPCGMHGYYNGCRVVDNDKFISNSLCIHGRYECMNSIPTELVISELQKLLNLKEQHSGYDK